MSFPSDTMSKAIHLCLAAFFVILGIGILAGRLLSGMPESSGIRTMLGLVLILFGAYRFVIVRFARPHTRRPYGGFRRRASPENGITNPADDSDE